HLDNQYDDIINAVEDIAIQTSYVSVPAKGKSPAKMGLRIYRFKDRLTRYIFGRTGILLDIKFKTRGLGRKAVFRDPRSPVESVTVRFVHLPPISSNAGLWKNVLTHRPTKIPGKVIPIPDKDRAGFRARVRAVLSDMGPSLKVWDKEGYRLSTTVFDEVEKLKQME
ncbi:MAG: hypothetical protein GY771_17350, partial [bacterium]|nr:hypothetical protein [bacterium]